MSRAYFVVHRNDEWQVKLERGRAVSTGHRKQSAAVSEAKRLARSPSTSADKVVVNRKDGATRRHIKNP